MSTGVMTGCARMLIVLLLLIQLACIMFCVLSMSLMVDLQRPWPIRYYRNLAAGGLWVIDSFVE